MIKKYQVTMYCTTEQYKPISTIVMIEQTNNDNLLLDENKRKEIINKGIVKICQKKYWTKRDIQKYHYTRAKAREWKEE